MRAAPLLIALLAPAGAHGFCGFFVSGADGALANHSSRVALMRKGTRTVVSMSNDYQGPEQDFALVVPVPVVLKKEDVRTLPLGVFDRIDRLSAPRLVEYWEQDPCRRRGGEGDVVEILHGDKLEDRKFRPGDREKPPTVKVEASFVTGEYDVLILSATEAVALARWLSDHGYRIPAGAAAALSHYIREQSKFFVAKVNIAKVHRDAHGVAVLSPLRFDYESPELRLPVRLGLINAQGPQDLIVFVLHPSSRMEVANQPNLFIPTNLEVDATVRGSFRAFYAALFDATVTAGTAKRHPGAVVTEYAWQAAACDPCPTAPLDRSDLLTLGDDVVSTVTTQDDRTEVEVLRGGRASNSRSNLPDPWVLTRLHTRYDRRTLSEDLVFREVEPVQGGRASVDGQPGLGAAQPARFNNFQARYVIRNYWKGLVRCEQPSFDVWGGPPGGGAPLLVPGLDLARAPRRRVSLASAVYTALPKLGLRGKRTPVWQRR